MPTYDYKCDACDYAFEKVQPITSESLKKCPKCGKSKLRRLIGPGGGFIFKGSGFYITDYRDSAYKEKAKAESGETKTEKADTSKPATETKADAKPAAAEVKTARTDSSKASKSAAPKAKTNSARGKK